MTCECTTWARAENIDLSGDRHHHSRCPKFETEKFPRMFYYEEAINAYCPCDFGVIETVASVDQLEDGEEMEIRFKRFDMTDKEFSEMPED